MTKPSIIITPHPRTISETFDAATWAELHDTANVIWGKDEPMPAAAFTAALATATAVAVGNWPYPAATLQAAGPNLEVIFEMLGTHDHPQLDYATCFARGILVGSIAPVFGDVVAEMCLALALAAARGVGISDRCFRTATEEYLHAGTKGSISLHGKTVGFVGCGAISRGLQSLLEPFGVTLIGYDPWLDPTALEQRGIEHVELEELFSRSNVVFVLAVPTPANKGMISNQLMALLAAEDVLVVASRAHVVEFEALTNHLLAGHFRAGIDVFPQEPLPPDHPIRQADGAVLTAHLAGALPEALHQIGCVIVQDLKDVLAGAQPRQMQYATPQRIHSLRQVQ